MAMNLVMHALRTILGNLGQALRVSVGPMLILGGALALLFFVGGIGIGDDVASPFFALAPLIMLPLALFVFGWIAVSWHRFILLEEESDLLPAYSGRPIWPYVGTTILLALRMMLIALPFLLIFGGLMGGSLSSGGGVGIFAIGMIAINLLISYLAMRWALVLPAKALDRNMRFKESWDATAPFSATILWVVVVIVVVNFVLGLVGGLFGLVPIVGILVNAAVSWLTGMLGISILTTLYGHIVEGRDLPQ